MRKLSALISFHCVVMFVVAQSIPGVPGIKNQFTSFHRGDEYITRITNPNSATAVFLPQYVTYGSGDMLASDSAYTAWLLSHGDPLKVFLAEISVLKSKFFSNREDLMSSCDTATPPRWNCDDVYSKLYSVIGSKLGQYNRKCGNAINLTINDLAATGLFSEQDFNVLNIEGVDGTHTVGEWRYQTRFAKFDNDMHEAGCMHTNTGSPNGFASIGDLYDNNDLITTDYTWVDPEGDTLDLEPLLNYSEHEHYLSYFADSTLLFRTAGHTVPTVSVSGIWKLCPGCMIENHVAVPRFALANSSFVNSHANFANFDTALVLMRKGGIGPAIRDTLDKYLSVLLDTVVTFEEQMADEVGVLASTIISQQDKAAHAWLDICVFPANPEFVPTLVPLLSITIPPHTDTLAIGEDLAFPGLVIRVNSSSASLIGDTLFTGNGDFYLWSMTDEGPVIPPTAINYLQQGWLAPSADTTRIWVTYNPAFINFYTGFGITGLNGMPLSVEEIYPAITAIPQTSAAANAEGSFFYPNPTTGMGKLKCDDCRYTLTDIYGRTLMTGNEPVVDLARFPAGIYFVSLGGATQKILKL